MAVVPGVAKRSCDLTVRRKYVVANVIGDDRPAETTQARAQNHDAHALTLDHLVPTVT